MLDYNSLKSIKVNSIRDCYCGLEYNCTFTFSNLSEEIVSFKAIIIPEGNIMCTDFFSDNYLYFKEVAEDVMNYTSDSFYVELNINNKKFALNSAYHNFVNI